MATRTSPVLVFLSGYMSSGKSTLAGIVKKVAESAGKQVQLLKFADPLYHLNHLVYEVIGEGVDFATDTLVTEIRAITGKPCDAPEFRAAVLDLVRYTVDVRDPYRQQAAKNRLFLQGIGTDIMRAQLGDDVLLTPIERAIRESVADLVICDDMRLPIEFALAQRLGAVTVSIDISAEARKQRALALGVWSENGHRTEAGLPVSKYPFDVAVLNDGDLDVLNVKALGLYARLFPKKFRGQKPRVWHPGEGVNHGHQMS